MSNQRKVVINEDPTNLDIEFDDDVDVEFVRIETSDAADAKAFDELDQNDTFGIDADESEGQYTSVEDLDDEEPIWDGGPTAGEIKEWKKQYGDIYVTSLTYDKHVVWRVLNRNEYKQIVKKMEQLMQAGTLSSAEANMWNEETIAELCILFPKYDKKSLSGILAGMPSLIAQEVLEASGFVALEVRQL